MLKAETITLSGLGSQFDPAAEVELLRRNPGAGEAVMTDILHFFAEFACNVPVISYHYIHTTDDRLVVPGLEAEGDALDMFANGVRPGSLRSQLEYTGFSLLREKILTSEEPSFALWASPPPDQRIAKIEGYGKYGFLYAALIPKHYPEQTCPERSRRSRRISMLAIRLNNFDQETMTNVGRLFQHLDPDIELPKNVKDKDFLLKPIVFPVGAGQKVTDIGDLFALLGGFVQKQFTPQQIEDGFTNKVIHQVYDKFKVKIHEIYTKIWGAAQRFDQSVRAEDLFRGLEFSFFAGSCPAKSSSKLASSTKQEGELHWCPTCGQLFRGTECECGYTLGGKLS
jgi:hypothetical protein